MTTKPVPLPPDSRRLPPLPDPPRKWDMQEFLHFDLPAVPNTLARHLDALRPDSTTFVAGRGYLCRRRSDLPRCPYPDLVVAFNVDATGIGETNGYVIDEAGKPPGLRAGSRLGTHRPAGICRQASPIRRLERTRILALRPYRGPTV